MEAEITRRGALDMQVCVPDSWNDSKVKEFAESNNPCGTSHGWFIRKEGDEMLKDKPERNSCHDREGFVHIMLDA